MNRIWWSQHDIDTVNHLYSIGMKTDFIGNAINRTKNAIKHYVSANDLKRDLLRYEEGLALLAAEGEQFRPIKGWSPEFYVSNLGRVASMGFGDPWWILTPWADKDGYLSVVVKDAAGKRRRKAIHYFVAITFVGDRPDGKGVAHKNGKCQDNRAENLCWKTQKENIADKIIHGTAQIGSKNGMAKIDEDQARQVKEYLKRKITIRACSQSLNIPFSIVAAISAGKAWRHA